MLSLAEIFFLVVPEIVMYNLSNSEISLGYTTHLGNMFFSFTQDDIRKVGKVFENFIKV